MILRQSQFDLTSTGLLELSLTKYRVSNRTHSTFICWIPWLQIGLEIDSSTFLNNPLYVKYGEVARRVDGYQKCILVSSFRLKLNKCPRVRFWLLVCLLDKARIYFRTFKKSRLFSFWERGGGILVGCVRNLLHISNCFRKCRWLSGWIWHSRPKISLTIHYQCQQFGGSR